MRLSDDALATLFRAARTHSAWQPREVADGLLREIVDLALMGPTSANCAPMRLVFVKSPAAKAQLKPCLSAGNVDKTMQAPVTAIVGHDMEFYEHLPRLFPHADARSWFAGKPDVIAANAFRNSSLQAAYVILAARSLGLDTGPMSGFDNAAVDAAFFAGTTVKSNMLINIGYGDPAALKPRLPRFAFSDIANIA